MHTYRKIAAAGATAAAIVGVGTAALAASGPESTAGSGTHAAGHPNVRALGPHRLLRHLVHGEVVSHSKNGYVTHAGIRGKATAVSASAITVKAGDGFSQTFTIGKDTLVRERVPGKLRGKPGEIGDVKTGDLVAVLGKAPESASGNPTATIVVDGVRK